MGTGSGEAGAVFKGMGDGSGVDTAHCQWAVRGPGPAWVYEGGDGCVGADERVACDEPDKGK